MSSAAETQEDILQAIKENPREIREVYVASWDKTVFVRELNGLELSEWHRACFDRKDDPSLAITKGSNDVHLIALCLCKSSGERIFVKPEDQKKLNQLPGKVVEVLSKAVLSVNGMNKEAREAAEKKPTSPENGSGNSSPADSAAQPAKQS